MSFSNTMLAGSEILSTERSYIHAHVNTHIDL